MPLILLRPWPRRVVVPGDDDLPLTAKQFDEDPQPVLLSLPWRLWPQPFADEDGLPLTSKGVDEDPQPVLTVIPYRVVAQPIDDEDPLPYFPNEDDHQWPLSWQRAWVARQPLADDEVLGAFQPTGEDDSPALYVAIARIVSQPQADEDGLPLTAKQIDEDPQPWLVSLPIRLYAQPQDDDEQMPSLPNEDDHQWPLSWQRAWVARQPISDDEVVASQPPVDDEAGWPITWLPLRLYVQPARDDDALPLGAKVVDDDYDPSYLRLAYLRPPVRQPGALLEEPEYHFVPVAGGPAAVVRLDTYDRGDGSVLLAWENFPGIANADSFNVYADGVLIGNVPAPGLQFVAGGYAGASYNPNTGVVTPPQSHVFNIVAIKGGVEAWTTLPVRVTFQPATVLQVTPMARPFPFPDTPGN